MRFYFDESGNFQLPPAGVHRVGIVSGIVIPDSSESNIFEQFDAFVSTLPASAFFKGEPKGKLLDEDCRRRFSEMIAKAPDLLVCPILLDLTSLAASAQSDVVSAVAQKLLSLRETSKHQTFRDDLETLANEVKRLSTQQCLRLAAWARCISRSIGDSIILHHGRRHESSWNTVTFEIDPVEENRGKREDTVFQTMLPMWVTSWSHNHPFTTIEGVHTQDHPLIMNWDTDQGIDVGKMFKNIRYVSSSESKGIQIADMVASLIRRALAGVAVPENLTNYGYVMSKSIGRSECAPGLFCLAPADPMDLARRYYGLTEAIESIRKTLPGAYCAISSQ